MTQTEKTIVVLPEINGDIEDLKKSLHQVGVSFSQLESQPTISCFDACIPDSLEIVIPGNFLDYSMSSNKPLAKIEAENSQVLGLVSALASDASTIVTLGANEVDAAGIIQRNDKKMHPIPNEVRDFVLASCVSGDFIHAGHLKVTANFGPSECIYDRRLGFKLFDDFVVTSGGVTYKMWKLLGMPTDATKLVDRLNSDLHRIAKELLDTSVSRRDRIYIPESLSASKYVQQGGYSKIASPSTAHANELHQEWDQVWCPNPQFGQLRSNMSIRPQRATFGSNEFSYEMFRVGLEDIFYPSIVARLSPIVSLNPRDRVSKSVDHGLVYFRGKTEPRVSSHDKSIGRGSNLSSQYFQRPSIVRVLGRN